MYTINCFLNLLKCKNLNAEQFLTGVTKNKSLWGESKTPDRWCSSVQPYCVELRLVLDAGVHFKHFSDGHGGVGRRREGELHLQGLVFTL